MSRLTAVQPEIAPGRPKELLDAVKQKFGLVPNMTRAMATAPAVLDGYLQFCGALARGNLRQCRRRGPAEEHRGDEYDHDPQHQPPPFFFGSSLGCGGSKSDSKSGRCVESSSTVLPSVRSFRISTLFTPIAYGL